MQVNDESAPQEYMDVLPVPSRRLHTLVFAQEGSCPHRPEGEAWLAAQACSLSPCPLPMVWLALLHVTWEVTPSLGLGQ